MSLKNGFSQKALIPYVTAGHPDLATTMKILRAIDCSGADIIEVGVPFSDPIADGPTIQRAAHYALERGFRLGELLKALAKVRSDLSARLMLFSYLNPLLQYGLEKLADEMKDTGIDGILMSDLIPEEAATYVAPFRKHSIDTVFLAAPTSGPRRLQSIARESRGFIYLVSRTGVTGARQDLSAGISEMVAAIRQASDLPVAVGFGISTRQQVEAVWRIADGAVVGSALVSVIDQYRDDPDACVRHAADFVKSLTRNNETKSEETKSDSRIARG